MSKRKVSMNQKKANLPFDTRHSWVEQMKQQLGCDLDERNDQETL